MYSLFGSSMREEEFKFFRICNLLLISLCALFITYSFVFPEHMPTTKQDVITLQVFMSFVASYYLVLFFLMKRAANLSISLFIYGIVSLITLKHIFTISTDPMAYSNALFGMTFPLIVVLVYLTPKKNHDLRSLQPCMFNSHNIF